MQVGCGGAPFGAQVACASPQGMQQGVIYALPYIMLQQPGPGSGPGFPGSPTGGPCALAALGPLPAAMPMTPADHQAMKNQVQNQIEYYFGKDNLIKDHYLRSKMNDEGWVPIADIAGFPRMRSITADMAIILEAINTSSVIEIHPDSQHVRLRDGWADWPIQRANGSMQAMGAAQAMGGAAFPTA